MTPISIKEDLDKKIYGQHKAKEVLSFAFYLHLLRIKNNTTENKIALPKSNVLIAGSTGSGKRLTLQTLAQTFKLPMLKIDCNIFLSGQSMFEVMDAYLRFLILQNGIEKAQGAVIVFEDFDRVVARTHGQAHNNIDLQEDFLAFLEQDEKLIQLEQDKQPIAFNLQNIMYAFAGKFTGIESLIYMRNRVENDQDDIIKKKEERMQLVEKFKALRIADISDNYKPNEGIGFRKIAKEGTSDELRGSIDKLYNELKEDELEGLVEAAFQKEIITEMNEDLQGNTDIITNVQAADLINYGVLAELMGRIGFVAPFHKLTQADIIQILKRPVNNIINQYKSYFKVHNNSLEIKPDVLAMIAKEVEARSVGTRSINTILLQLLSEYLYQAPTVENKKFVVNAKYYEAMMGSKEI